jgi:hypothetical protein
MSMTRAQLLSVASLAALVLGGCRDTTAPKANAGLPQTLTLRVGGAAVLVLPVNSRAPSYDWKVSDPAVVHITPSRGTGECYAGLCAPYGGDGHQASLNARAPGRATLRVLLPTALDVREVAVVEVTVQGGP